MMTQTPDINLTSSAFKENPYSVFTQMRTNNPVQKITMPGGHDAWFITSYAVADSALRDPRFVKNINNVLTPEELVERFPRQAGSDGQMFSHHMLSFDPPSHTRLRALVNLTFTPRLVEHWRARIQAITDELLDAIQDQKEVDLLETFAFPLPIIVISEMLGVSSADRNQFRIWSNMILDATGNPAAFKDLQEELGKFHAYVRKLVEEKRQNPAEDLLSQLIATEAAGDKLSAGELVSMVFLLIVAGHETTVNLIGNGVLALLSNPSQLEKLKQDPTLIKTAIEEFLRYRSPVMTSTTRWAREDVIFEGQQIKRGEQVLAILAAANHDPNSFDDPEELDISRPENRHLAFGKGIHYCLGAPLARLEGQIAINTLLHRQPNLRLSVDPQSLVWRPGLLILGLSNLPVAF
jgi:cytochrome P450